LVYGDIGIYVDYATVYRERGLSYGGNTNNVQGGVRVLFAAGVAGVVTVYGNVNGGNGIAVPGGVQPSAEAA